jgi:peptidoglycan/xylan/chitin deacetylase (PgdA/CDA1 family)
MLKMKSLVLSVARFIFVTVLANASFAQSVAITMDNPNTDPAPLFKSEVRDKKILSVIKKNHLKIVLFAQGAQVDSPQGRALLNRWNNAGQTIGNHSYSHFNIKNVSDTVYQQDVLKNEKLLKSYPHFKKIFRFPFLKEGDTVAKRDQFRKFLHDHHYENGSVTIDASDWYISDRLETRLAQNPKTNLAPYKKYYLDHIWNRAQYYDNLAKKILGRSPNHTLLLHHNLLNALFLDDLIQMFRAKGWIIIDADKAYQDSIFKLTPNTLPAGESIIWSLAKETGRYEDQLRYPGEDESYEKNAMDKLGL